MDDQSLQILVYSTVAAAPFLLGLLLPCLMLVPHGMMGPGWWPKSPIVIGILTIYGVFVGTGMTLATWMKRTGQVE